MTGWELSNRHPSDQQSGRDGVRQRFVLQQARLNARFRFTDRLKAKISLDLSDALGGVDLVPYLRDAWANVELAPAFQIRAGRLKRPFSRLENRGASALPFRGRGLYNSLAIEELAWGDRTVGAMFWGKVEPARIKWEVMASNPAPNSRGIDVSGRVQVEPTSWLELAGNGGYKHLENAAGDYVSAAAAGGDVRIRAKGLYTALEFSAAQDWAYSVETDDAHDTFPWTMGFVGYVNYDVPINDRLVLQPIVLGEWADSNSFYTHSESVRILAGFNVLWGEYVRVLPQVELIRPIGTASAFNRWAAEETYYLILSLQM